MVEYSGRMEVFPPYEENFFVADHPSYVGFEWWCGSEVVKNLYDSVYSFLKR